MKKKPAPGTKVYSPNRIMPHIEPAYKVRGGFGVAESDLVDETKDIKLWRKRMLAQKSQLREFCTMGMEESEALAELLRDLDYHPKIKQRKNKDGTIKVKKKPVTYMPAGQNPYTKMLWLANNNIFFIHSHTSTSTTIETAERKFLYIPKGYSLKEMHQRRRLKKNIFENIAAKNLVVPEFTNKDSKYIDYSDTIKNLPLDCTLTDLDEFDISKAYYNSIYQLGYISEAMYKECLELPKQVRLRFIGSIATFKRHYAKAGWNIEGYFAEKDPILRRVWFHVVKQVDDCLTEFKEMVGDKFLLYYVDGIYVRKYANAETRELFDYTPVLDHLYAKYGFTFTHKEVYGITRTIESRRKNSMLYIYKHREKDDLSGRKINIFGMNYGKYWVRKDFNIKKGGGHDVNEVPEWQNLMDDYYKNKNSRKIK